MGTLAYVSSGAAISLIQTGGKGAHSGTAEPRDAQRRQQRCLMKR